MIQIPINLDITKPYRTPITINQLDTDEPVFLFTLRNNGALIDLTGTTVVFYAEKPDGNVLFNACDITDATKGKCAYTVTSQTTATAGTLTCQIVVTFASGAEKRSQEFSVTVKPSLDITGAVESTSEFTELQQAIAQTNIQNIITAVKHAMYPIGSIIFTTTSDNPASEYGGTWEEWGAGRVPVGVDTEQTEFNTVEKTGGAVNVTLTTSQIPSHRHRLQIADTGYFNVGDDIRVVAPSSEGTGGTESGLVRETNHGGATTASPLRMFNTGNGEPHNNVQPYITCYMWKRVA